MLDIIKSRMISLKAVVDQLQLKANEDPAGQLEANMNQILLNMALFESSSNNDDKKRKAIALMREHIQHLNVKLDDLQTESAEEYRKELGEKKEAFEKLTDLEQKQRNPAAFRCRNTFHLLIQMKDTLSLLSSVLMDVSGELEKKMQDAKGSSSADTTPTKRFDRDPAPSHLTP